MSQSEDRRLPVPLPGGREERRRRQRGASAEGAYTAHLFGQHGARRGLRGGRYVIDQAHSAYRTAEWSGSADRRRPRGGLLEGEI